MTGLDYLDQRYYANNFGRFLSPDPYSATGGAMSPASWNRYSYTRGDPVNRFDRGGLQDQGAARGLLRDRLFDVCERIFPRVLCGG